MVYQIDNIIRDVRISMDENRISDQLLNTADVDTLSMDELIRSKVEEAVRRIETSAPAHFLEEGHDFASPIYWGSKESGWLLLPDDFMRLIAFKMSDWERTCYTAVSADDPIYQLQSSRYKGIRGNVQKPVCAVVNRPEGKALEFYSCNSEEATISRANYLPYPCIDEDGGIDISERCYTAVVYTIAALVLTALGESQKASELNDLAKSIFQ